MNLLTVLFDIKNPQAFLALQPTLMMLDELRLEADWQPLLVAPLSPPVEPAADAERGVLHRWHRARYRIADLRRYAAARGLPDDCFSDARLFDSGDGRVAAAGYIWCREHAPELSLATLSSLFSRYWQDRLDLNSLEQVNAVITEVAGRDLELPANAEQALAALDTMQNALRESGGIDVPGYLVAGQSYYGRQHLPMVSWHLRGEEGDPPVWGRFAT